LFCLLETIVSTLSIIGFATNRITSPQNLSFRSGNASVYSIDSLSGEMTQLNVWQFEHGEYVTSGCFVDNSGGKDVLYVITMDTEYRQETRYAIDPITGAVLGSTIQKNNFPYSDFTSTLTPLIFQVGKIIYIAYYGVHWSPSQTLSIYFYQFNPITLGTTKLWQKDFHSQYFYWTVSLTVNNNILSRSHDEMLYLVTHPEQFPVSTIVGLSLNTGEIAVNKTIKEPNCMWEVHYNYVFDTVSKHFVVETRGLDVNTRNYYSRMDVLNFETGLYTPGDIFRQKQQGWKLSYFGRPIFTTSHQILYVISPQPYPSKNGYNFYAIDTKGTIRVPELTKVYYTNLHCIFQY